MYPTPQSSPTPPTSLELEGESHMDLVLTLRAAGCVFAEQEALILSEAAGTCEELARLTQLRCEGVPLEQIVGWAAFHGLRITVTAGVFVPRLRTEFLVANAALFLGSIPHPESSVMLDLCCGSGAIATVLAKEFPALDVFAADVDPAAIACATENLKGSGTALQSDLFDGLPSYLRGTLNLITANAPYVPSDDIEFMPREAREFEPVVALDGGMDGLDLHRRIAGEAMQWLASGGLLVIESSDRQATRSQEIFESAGFYTLVERSEHFDSTVVLAHAP